MPAGRLRPTRPKIVYFEDGPFNGPKPPSSGKFRLARPKFVYFEDGPLKGPKRVYNDSWKGFYIICIPVELDPRD